MRCSSRMMPKKVSIQPTMKEGQASASRIRHKGLPPAGAVDALNTPRCRAAICP